MTTRIQEIKSFLFTPQDVQRPVAAKGGSGKAPVFPMSKVQFMRIRHDIGMWRSAIVEAENAYLPFRVRMQRMYQDTVLNEHLFSCMDRRKDLTLLRDFKICDEKGEESEELKQLFRNYNTAVVGTPANTASWFDDFVSFVLDSDAYGYNLISLGDIEHDSFPNLSIMPRQNISPDRLNVSTIPNMSSGIKFLEGEYVDWYIWVPTPSKIGGKCGYGYLYEVAKAEIYLRQNTAYNADYNEIYGMPIRKGTTTKQDDERAAFEAALANMGHNAYILLDEGQDNIELVDHKQTSGTISTYADFEKRMEAKISKVILGHADALDSIPGKLGAGQGDDNPASQALSDKQVKDGKRVENVVNTQLLPRMRKHGFKIPLNYHFEYKNDQEKEEFRRREDDSNTKTATLFKTIADAGGDLTEEAWKYFEDRTGIPVKMKEKIELPPTGLPNQKQPENANTPAEQAL